MRGKCTVLNNNRSRIVYYILAFSFVILCCLFSSFRVSSVLSFLIFLVFELIFVMDSPRIILKYLYFFFMMTANVIGCLVCEFGDFFLVELGTQTRYVGALPNLILSQMVFFTCIFELDNIMSKKYVKGSHSNDDKINERYLIILNCFVLLIYTLIFVHILPYSALKMNVDRMTFSSMGFNSGIWNYLSKWAQFFVVIPIVCIVYGQKRVHKIMGLITVGIYCLYYLWIGNKFGSFFGLFCVFCIICFSRINIKEKILKKVFFVVVTLTIVLVLGAAFIFTRIQNQNAGINIYLQNRLAEQGQLFWKTYEVTSDNNNISKIDNELAGQFRRYNSAEELVGAKHGIYNIMYICAPRNKVDAFIIYGSRYTEAGYASAYYYLGVPGCIVFAIIFGCLVVFVTNYVIFSTNNNSLFGIILMTRMYFIISGAWQLFLFKDLLTGTSLITYIWLFTPLSRCRVYLKDKNTKIGIWLKEN